MLYLLIILAVILLIAPVTRYGGYYPARWSAGYGWLPLVLVLVLLLWLLNGGHL